MEFSPRIDRAGREPDVGPPEEVTAFLAQILDRDTEGRGGEVIGVNRGRLETERFGGVLPLVDRLVVECVSQPRFVTGTGKQ